MSDQVNKLIGFDVHPDYRDYLDTAIDTAEEVAVTNEKLSSELNRKSDDNLDNERLKIALAQTPGVDDDLPEVSEKPTSTLPKNETTNLAEPAEQSVELSESASQKITLESHKSPEIVSFTFKPGLLISQINSLLKKHFSEYTVRWNFSETNDKFVGKHTVNSSDKWQLLDPILSAKGWTVEVPTNNVLIISRGQ